MSYLSCVAEFHSAYRYCQPEPKLPRLNCRATNALRPNLMREELQELQDAILSAAKVEQLDALCDLQYVLSGAVLAWGLRPMFEAISMPREPRPIHDLGRAMMTMADRIDEMESCATENYPAQLLALITFAQSDLHRLVIHLGFSEVFDDAFMVVHANNMDKFWSADEMDASADKTLRFEWTAMRGYIARRADGKIVKPPHHRKVDLTSLVK